MTKTIHQTPQYSIQMNWISVQMLHAISCLRSYMTSGNGRVRIITQQ